VTWGYWGVAGKGAKRAARGTVFEYGQAPRAQDPAASGVRRGEAGLRSADPGAQEPQE
jgi:hypothetical protein